MEQVGRWYPTAKRFITPVFKAAWSFDVRGLDNIPERGGAILCPNHTSVLDSFFLPALLPRQVIYVGKSEYMDDWKTRTLFPALGMVPIDREGGDSGERALATAQRILEQGKLFGIYPEGTRSRDGRLYRGHTGPARLAMRTGAPIIPIGIKGAREVMPPEAKLPKVRMPVAITFGRPIDVTRYTERGQDHLVLRQIIDEVMYEIREMSGQEYVDSYATKKKKPVAEPVDGGEASTSAQAGPVELDVDPAEIAEARPPRTAAEALNAPARHGGSTNGHGRHRSTSRRMDEDTEVVAATSGRSSADLLSRPVVRTGS